MVAADTEPMTVFSAVVEDVLPGAGIVDEGNDPHLTMEDRATQSQGFIRRAPAAHVDARRRITLPRGARKMLMH